MILKERSAKVQVSVPPRGLGWILAVLLIWGLDLQAFEIQAEEPRDPQSPTETVDFDTDVMPVFSRYGCNAAECHGSSAGRGDFRLSLFGGDPQRDYEAIVFDLEGRRIQFTEPARSLIVTKPIEEISHEGGEIFPSDSQAAKILGEWIRQGAKRSRIRTLKRLDAEPASLTLKTPGSSVQLTITAKFTESDRDVSEWVNFESTNPAAVTVTSDGKATVRQPGRHYVIASFLNRHAIVPVVVPFGEAKSKPSARKSTHSSNQVDQLLEGELEALNLQPAPATKDSNFVRRIYLDLAGRLPTAAERKEFLNSKSVHRKKELAIRILGSEDFERHWTYWLKNLIRASQPGNDEKAGQAYYEWLRKQVALKRPWTEITSDLLTSSGDSHAVGPANFHRQFNDPRQQGETVADAFLGIQIGCANCHNHPLDRWTQEDYHGLAAVFARIKRGKRIETLPDGAVIQPRTGLPQEPRIPGKTSQIPANNAQKVLADWMIDGNRQFSRAAVNRIWKHFFARGFVEPVNDLRATNPPLFPEVLDGLADFFAESGFRFQPLILEIVTSDAYGRRTSDGDHLVEYFAAFPSRPLEPEVFYDSARQLLDPNPAGWSTEIFADENLDPSLRVLKGCTQTACDPVGPSQTQLGVREKLHLINGGLLNRWIGSSEGWLMARRQARVAPVEILAEFYLRAFCRPMTSNEQKFWRSAFSDKGSAEEVTERLEDAIWSLINCREMTTNH